MASALGLLVSLYFALEAEGFISNILASRSPLLAHLFSEKSTTHLPLAGSWWFRTLVFGVALVVDIVTDRHRLRSASGIRAVWVISTFVLPLTVLLQALFIQPAWIDGFCAPCMLTGLFALAILECRKGPMQNSDTARTPTIQAVLRQRRPSSFPRAASDGDA